MFQYYLVFTIYLPESASIQPRTGLSKFAKNLPKVGKEVRISIGRDRPPDCGWGSGHKECAEISLRMCRALRRPRWIVSRWRTRAGGPLKVQRTSTKKNWNLISPSSHLAPGFGVACSEQFCLVSRYCHAVSSSLSSWVFASCTANRCVVRKNLDVMYDMRWIMTWKA